MTRGSRERRGRGRGGQRGEERRERKGGGGGGEKLCNGIMEFGSTGGNFSVDSRRTFRQVYCSLGCFMDYFEPLCPQYLCTTAHMCVSLPTRSFSSHPTPIFG